MSKRVILAIALAFIAYILIWGMLNYLLGGGDKTNNLLAFFASIIFFVVALAEQDKGTSPDVGEADRRPSEASTAWRTLELTVWTTVIAALYLFSNAVLSNIIKQYYPNTDTAEIYIHLSGLMFLLVVGPLSASLSWISARKHRGLPFVACCTATLIAVLIGVSADIARYVISGDIMEGMYAIGILDGSNIDKDVIWYKAAFHIIVKLGVAIVAILIFASFLWTIGKMSLWIERIRLKYA